MELVIDSQGLAKTVYTEMIDLRSLGSLTLTRASHVEPDSDGNWLADLSPVGGPVLGPFAQRSSALSAELVWLEEHWLNRPMR
jgi:hypothetical protein